MGDDGQLLGHESVLSLRLPWLSFTVPSVPVAQPRPRAISMFGRGRMVPPPKSHAVHDFKATIRKCLEAVYTGPPIEGPLQADWLFVMPRPKSMIWKTKPMPRVWYFAAKNDWDNLGKSCSDAMNKLLYRDDGQLCDIRVRRVVASGHEQAHVEIELWKLGELVDSTMQGRTG